MSEGHWFGLKVPPAYSGKCVRVYGARANFYRKPNLDIDVPSDRQQFDPPEDFDSDARREFYSWIYDEILDPKAKNGLYHEVRKHNIYTDDDYPVEFHSEDGKYHLIANPKRSYGYIYIVAWESRTDV